MFTIIATLVALAIVANLFAGMRRASSGFTGGLRARLTYGPPDLGTLSWIARPERLLPKGDVHDDDDRLPASYDDAVLRMRDIQDEIDRLSNRDDLDEADQTRWDGLVVEFNDLDRHAKKLVRDAQRAKVAEAVESARHSNRAARVERPPVADDASSSNGYDVDPIDEPRSAEDHNNRTRGRDPWDLSNLRTYGRAPERVTGELRNRAYDAVERMKGASDKVREAGTKILEQEGEEQSKIASFILATSSPAYLRAFSKAARNPMGPNFTPDEQRAVEAVRAMSLTDSAGGFLVPFQLDPTVIITANGSVNDIRQVAREVVGMSDTWQGVSSGAVSWSWDAEASQVSDDATTFAQPSIPVYMARGFVPISLEARQDEANIAQEVGRLLAFGKDVLEAATFATGTGSQPTGIITALVASSPTSIVTSATADTLALADIYALQSALPARYRRQASWLANNLIYNRIRQFDTSGGGGFWANLNDDRPPQLLNRSALESEDMDGTLTALAENYVAVFGDFSNYVIVDRLGVTVDFIPHLFQQTTAGSGFGRPTGQSGWFAYYRAGADSVNDGAFRLLNVT